MVPSKITTYAVGVSIIALGVVVFDPTAVVLPRTEIVHAVVAPEPTADLSVSICGFDYPSSPVVEIAADEIARLSETYPSVCDVLWTFGGMTDYLGLAYDNDQNLIIISTVEEYYTQGGADLDAIVRHVVRHEFGHQVTYLTHTATIPENTNVLAELFATTPDIAWEVAADAFSVALDDSGSFPCNVTLEQVDTARNLLINLALDIPATVG